jgi:hypothetical protein
LQAAGFYKDVDLGEPEHVIDEVEKKIAEKMGFNATEDDRFKLLEIHANLDLDNGDSEDGIALPYVVTMEKGTGTILAIRRNWDPEDKKKAKRQHFVHYGYIPGFGFYCFGLIHLIGAFAKSGTMLLRQLVDAGTLNNLPGGLKSRGLRIKGDDTPIAPGEWRDVDVPSGSIRDNILPLPYKEPSQVLQSLMNGIIEEGRRFASAADLQVSDMSANSPVGTTLAILERTLKVMSAVQARIYYAMKQEFKLLKGIIRDYTPSEYSYEPSEGSRRAKQADYDDVDVIPVSDPNASTMSQKVVQYQAVMQMVQASPDIYDRVELNKQMLEVLGIKNVGKLIPAAEDQKPKDPVSENMAVLNGKPVKAFIYQDHEAHIAVHMAAMQDPKIMQIVGQSPMAQQMQAAMTAHINEHVAYEYRKQIEEQLGIALPDEDEEIPKDIESDISRLTAQAAQQLLQKNQAEAQQQQAQQQQQDPIIQMQQQELQIKAQDSQAKAQKMMADVQLEQAKLELEKEKIASQERIAGIQIGAKTTLDNQRMELEAEKIKSDKMKDGIQMGINMIDRVASHKTKEKDQKINAIDKLMQHGQKDSDRQMAREVKFNQPQEQNPQQPKE